MGRPRWAAVKHGRDFSHMMYASRLGMHLYTWAAPALSWAAAGCITVTCNMSASHCLILSHGCIGMSHNVTTKPFVMRVWQAGQ